MDLHTLSRLPLSAEHGWPELARSRPGLLRVFVTLVLPLSLVPPVMLYFAGTYHPEMFGRALAAKSWGEVSAVFFVAEIATLLAMGWFIRQVAASHGLAIDRHDAYLLAAIAPVPMWLSALGLLIPSLLVAAIIAIAGLVLSCGIVYHGIQALGRSREEVSAAGVVQTVIGAGLVAWAFLLLVALT
jgi:hypothetical protein